MPVNELFAAARWWFVLTLLGVAATPLTLYLFKRLPDRGYAFVKLVGVLMVSYLFWIFASLRWLGNDLGGTLFALLCLIAISYWIERRAEVGTLAWMASHRRYVLATELLFLVMFGLWVWVRAQNPAITATEKPMEFAFLNAIGRSPSMPPSDPWLSGFAISYYYFGYVMTSLIGRLASAAEPIAFNLGIAWLVAGTAISAFGLVYNLSALHGKLRSAMLLGLIAAIALPLGGNLEFGLELLHENGVGSAELWRWLDIREINGPPVAAGTPRYESSSWWWWRSSRVIHEYHLSGRAEEGLEPIAEFPAFSFVLGDMHPHVLALPFAFLSLALSFTWWLSGSSGDKRLDTRTWDEAGWRARIDHLANYVGLPRLLFTALLLGGLSFLNTWDVLIHLSLVLGAFILGQISLYGWSRRVWARAWMVSILLIVPAILFYLPFYLGFRSQAGPPYLLPMMMRPTRLAQFLVIFGMPLWSIGLMLLATAVDRRIRAWRTGLTVALAVVALFTLLAFMLGWIVASSPAGAQRVTSLAAELDITLPAHPIEGISLGWGLAAIAALIPAVVAARLNAPGLTLLLAALLGIAVMLWRDWFASGNAANVKVDKANPEPGIRSSMPFVLLLIAVGTLLTLAPEFVYLRDNFGVRLNTVFKFYYQAWVMFGVAAVWSLGHLWSNYRVGSQRVVFLLASSGYVVGLAVALLFTVYAVRSRAIEFRGTVGAESRRSATLDGFAALRRFDPDEYAAINWLRENVPGMPVIAEAVGGQYSGFARVSAGTGLPTILGWAGHELQWRGSSTAEPTTRDPLVRQIYMSGNWENTAQLLNELNVTYVYLGGLERSAYGPQLNEKFDRHLEVAFRNDSVTIYQWHPE